MTKVLGRKALDAANIPALQHRRNSSSCAVLAPAKSLTALHQRTSCHGSEPGNRGLRHQEPTKALCYKPSKSVAAILLAWKIQGIMADKAGLDRRHV